MVNIHAIIDWIKMFIVPGSFQDVSKGDKVEMIVRDVTCLNFGKLSSKKNFGKLSFLNQIELES